MLNSNCDEKGAAVSSSVAEGCHVVREKRTCSGSTVLFVYIIPQEGKPNCVSLRLSVGCALPLLLVEGPRTGRRRFRAESFGLFYLNDAYILNLR